MGCLYNEFEMEITLNRVGYDLQDIETLIAEPFDTIYPIKISFGDYASVSGQDRISLELIFKVAFTGALTVFVSKLTSDLYDWSKNALRQV